MAKHKCPECPEGAPDWLVSYGDMTTLLLCFFVFLLVTAKVDVDKLSKASGYMANKMGVLPGEPDARKPQRNQDANSGTPGDSPQTTKIEEGPKTTLGSKEMFEKGKATPKMTSEIIKKVWSFANQVRGLRNIIEVRGHASSDEKNDKVFKDAMDLSIERARAIRDYLVNNCNIPRNRIRIVGCSYHEQIKSDLMISTEWQNRRVEIRTTEKYNTSNPDTNVEQ